MSAIAVFSRRFLHLARLFNCDHVSFDARSAAGRCRTTDRLSPKPNRCTQVQFWMRAGATYVCWVEMNSSVCKASSALRSNRLSPAFSNRTGAKFSPHPVTKQPKCGIWTATKPCRLRRLDKRSGHVAVAVRSEQSRLTRSAVSLHSTMAQSNRFTGLKLQTTAASWPAAGIRHWRYGGSSCCTQKTLVF